MYDYLHDVKGVVDELTFIDNVVTNDELVIYILNILSSDFENISATFLTRDMLISFEEIYEKLMEHANYKNQIHPKPKDHALTVHAAGLSIYASLISFLGY